MKKINNNITIYIPEGNKMVCIKCKNVNESCFDTFNLNTKDDENEVQSCIKKLSEKAEINLDNLKYCRAIKVEQQNNNESITKDYLATKVNGKALELEDNYGYLKYIKEILNNGKNFASTYLSNDDLLKYFNTENLITLYSFDDNHNIINMEII